MQGYMKNEEKTIETKIHSIYQSFSVNVKSLCRIYFLYCEINLAWNKQIYIWHTRPLHIWSEAHLQTLIQLSERTAEEKTTTQ